MSATREIRVLHWNIHSWLDATGQSNMDAVTDLIKQTDPDVVSLVEVDETWGAPPVLATVAQQCGYTSIFTPTLEYGKQQPEGGFGNALLSKLPVSAVIQRQLVWPTTIYDGTEPSELRTVTFAKLDSLWVGTTHLPRSDADARTAALQRLRTMTTELGTDWLLCGDFNTPATSWLAEARNVVVAPTPAVPTYPTEKPIEAIDYCLASPDISLNAKILGASGSDHLALLVSATLPTTNS